MSLDQIRHEYRACLKLEAETDSRREAASLKLEASELLRRLQDGCKHVHTVTLQSPYSGSYSMDYDDRQQGHRICLCCGTYEYAWQDDEYEILTVPFARFERGAPDEVKNPLGYLLTEAVQAAEKGYRP